MAIVGQIVVESRRYSGWLDPRYPIGFWQAALSVTGNATGGLLAVDLVFQTANGAQRLNSQMYSVERLGITSTEDSDRTVRVTASNMGGPANVAFSQEYGIFLDNLTGITGAAIAPGAANILPWFLGSQRLAGQTTSLSMVTSNVDTIVFKMEAEGYRWSPRSVLIDGGPQRPPTGIYRQ